MVSKIHTNHHILHTHKILKQLPAGLQTGSNLPPSTAEEGLGYTHHPGPLHYHKLSNVSQHNNSSEVQLSIPEKQKRTLQQILGLGHPRSDMGHERPSDPTSDSLYLGKTSQDSGHKARERPSSPVPKLDLSVITEKRNKTASKPAVIISSTQQPMGILNLGSALGLRTPSGLPFSMHSPSQSAHIHQSQLLMNGPHAPTKQS